MKQDEITFIERVQALKLEEDEILFIKVPEKKLTSDYVSYVESVLASVIDTKKNPIFVHHDFEFAKIKVREKHATKKLKTEETAGTTTGQKDIENTATQ